jgi:hypothetical protein
VSALDLTSLLPDVLDEWRGKSKNALYRTDPEAWAFDVLGKQWWEKQREIADSYVRNVRTGVKSANGTGKSYLVADLICHWVSVYDIDEALAIVSAPTIPQIDRVVFAYLKNNYNIAIKNKSPMRGYINEALEWKYDTPAGKQFLAFGKRPADKDIVSSFQGTRKDRTAVFLDEAGGVPPDLYTAAEAVMTGSASRFIAIGNPDKRGTQFFDIYNKPELSQDWNLFTISAFDLPTFTGEVVYDDPEAQRALLNSGMTTRGWVEHKRRAWGEGTARWQSKVLGEFPGEDDSTFFPQDVIDKAMETEITPDEDDIIRLGADIARMGQDETVLYSNHGGKIRLVNAWSKLDNIAVARNLHTIALQMGAHELRIDAAGTGSGVFDALMVLDEFKDKTYECIGVQGANSSPNPNKWAQARSWHYDQFREGMKNGRIDLDLPADKKIYDELISQTYDFNNRSAIQISSKKDMKKAGLTSPDYLDAAIYSFFDLDYLDAPAPGRTEVYDADEILAEYMDDDPFPY